MKKDLFPDADLFAHKICCSLSYGKLPEEVPSFRIFCAAFKQLYAKEIRRAQETFEIRKVYTILTSKDKSNFRYKVDIDPPYKHNRKETPDPKFLHELREWVAKKYRATVVHGMEADDAIGIECAKNPKNTIRISEKDLRMIPGWHMEMSTAFNQMPIYVTDPGQIWLKKKGVKKDLEGYGYKWYAAQMIIGDTADGIKGIPGAGPAKAFELLADVHTEEDMDKVLLKEYIKAGVEDKYEKHKKLLWILREPL